MVAMRMGLLLISLSSSLGLAAAAACDAQALARPVAVGAMATSTSYLVRSCGGFKGGTFSARLLNPSGADIALFLGVGAAQCGASCVAPPFFL